MTTNIEFLNRVAQDNKPTFISTGMYTVEEIKTAVDIFNQNNCEFVLMYQLSII